MSRAHQSIAAAALALATLACKDTRVVLPDAERLAAPLGDSVLVVINDMQSAVSLGGDRWAVLSVTDALVHLVDFGKKTSTPLGLGPKPALRHPYAIFAQADTLFIADWELGRVTAWSPEGMLLRDAITREAVGALLPTARDAAGQFFVERAPDPKQDGSGNKDSAAVVRLRGTVFDTVGRLAPLDLSSVNTENGARFEKRLLSGQDRWGVLPDGSLWIARIYANRVDWTNAKGDLVKGQLLPDRVLEVTQTDRELLLRKYPADARQRAELLPFAAIKPPFEAAWTGSGNRIWLEKGRSDSDTVRQYQVIDRAGRYVRLFELPGRARIFGEADGRILVGARIAEGMLLRRATLPEPPPAPAPQ